MQVAKYSNSSSDLWIHLTIANKEQLQDKKTMSPYHTCVLIIGDQDNKIVYQRKIMYIYFITYCKLILPQLQCRQCRLL